MAIKAGSKSGSLNVQIKKAQVAIAEKQDAVEAAKQALQEEKNRLGALTMQRGRK